ncbi:MAG: M48 family metalloprotease [Bacteroidia bacterium]|nr:M48 family metalloprotease [Bacteroidia bacterium]
MKRFFNSRWLQTVRLLLITGIVCVSIQIWGCKKNGEGFNIFSIEDDKALGAKTAAQIESDPANYPILPEEQYPVAYQHLRRIRDNILNSGKVPYRDEFAWQVKIIRDDNTLNAFCTPGGYIYVYTGLIKFLDAENELAGVMGHEIAHAARRHSTDNLTKAYGIQTLLEVVLGKNQGLLTDIAANLLILKFSRSHETDADEQSVIYLYSTEYDARGTAKFFEKLTAQGQGSSVPAFLSTHPNPDNRIQNINAKWSSLGGRTGQTYPQRYQEFKNSLP